MEEEESAGEPIPDSSFAQMYSGHCNMRTVKEGIQSHKVAKF